MPLRPTLFALLALLALLAASPASAITIYAYSADTNNRFASGFPSAPVANTNSSFIGLGEDYSAVGWVTGTGNTGGTRMRNFTMISPLHWVGAKHYPPGTGSGLRFLNPNDQLISATLKSTATISVSKVSSNDVLIGRLTDTLDATQRITPMRLLDVSNRDYEQMPLRILGSKADAVGHQIGLGRYSGNDRIGWDNFLSNTGAGSVNTWESGDSGSPMLIAYSPPDGAKQLTFVGHAWFAGSANAFHPYATYDYSVEPNVAIIADPTVGANGELKKDGYALKWTIYDAPTDTARTAHRWSGAASTGELATDTNWSLGTTPSNLPVLFDASAANSQTALTLAADRTLRGILFKASATSGGFTFSGAGKLTLGTTGLRNEASATQTLGNALIASTHQNWEAANGPLVFNGTVALGANLVVIGGAQDTTLNGIVSGTGGSLAKDDAGLLTLNAVNTYTGPTFLHNGTLRLGPAGNLSASTQVVIDNAAATLDLNGRNQTLADLRNAYSGTGEVKLGNATLTVNTTLSNTFDGILSGPGSLIKTGNGTWTLTGINTFTGGTTVNGGTLALVGGRHAAPLTVNSGGTLGFTLGSTVTSSSSLNLVSGSKIKLTGTPVFASYTLLAAASGITGTPVLDTPIADYALVLESANTVLKLKATTSGLPENLFWGGGNTTVASDTPVTGGAGQWSATTANWAANSAGTSYQTWTPGAVASFTRTAGNVQLTPITNNYTPSVGGLYFTTSSATWTLSGNNRVTFTAGAIIDTGNNTVNLNGASLSGSTGFEKTGTGTLALYTNDSTAFTGTITHNGGTLQVRSNNAAGRAATINVTGGTSLSFLNISSTSYGQGTGGTPLALTIADSATAVALNSTRSSGTNTGTINTLGTLSLGARTVNITQSTFTTSSFVFGNTTLTGDTTLNIASGMSVTLGTLGQSGGTRGLTKTGTGTLLLNGPGATYTGPTVLTAGTLQIAAADVLGDSSPLTLGGGSLSFAGYSETAGPLIVTATTVIDFPANSRLSFADSSGQTWSANLSLANFDPATSRLRFGTTASGLTAAQLARITVNGKTAAITADGYITTLATAWTWDNFGTFTETGNAAPTADPDGDGIQNLLERALGLDPNVAGTTGLPVLATASDYLTLRFTRAARTTDLTYTVEASSTLAADSWTTIYTATGVTAADEVTVTDTEALTANPKRFLRLKVTVTVASTPPV